MFNGCQPLNNVTMNYILDVAGSHICYCHNIPTQQTLKHRFYGPLIKCIYEISVRPSKLIQPSFAII